MTQYRLIKTQQQENTLLLVDEQSMVDGQEDVQDGGVQLCRIQEREEAGHAGLLPPPGELRQVPRKICPERLTLEDELYIT